MRASFRMGRIMGIEIGVHYSWFIIFALLTWSLAVAYYPNLYTGWEEWTYWLMATISSLLLFGSVLAHELGHSFVAMKRGIPVSNITLFIFGGAANITKEAEKPAEEFTMAIIGPIVSFATAVVFWLIHLLLQDISQAIAAITLYLALVNLVLGAFNLIPGFPLDGGRVLRAILWWRNGNFKRATKVAASTGQVFAYIFIIGGIAAFFLVGYLGGLWLAFIGWFLASAASGSYQQTIISDIMKQAKVKDVMTTNFQTASPSESVEKVMNEYIMQYNQRAVPIIRDARFMGLVTITDIKKVKPERANQIPILEIMTSRENLKTVKLVDDLSGVLQQLQSGDYNQLPVLDHDDNLVGLITRSDLIRFIQLRQESDSKS
jgi:Zn-dependent protease/CBS domain-containing protein